MPERPKVDRLTDYYAKSMMTKPMKWFCRMSGKSKFTETDIAGMKATAALRAADRNPYSWNKMCIRDRSNGRCYGTNEVEFTFDDVKARNMTCSCYLAA